jgi:hypothetical protein
MLTRHLSPHWGDLPLTRLYRKQYGSPLFESHAPLVQIVVSVIDTLDAAQLVPEAALGDLASNAECGEMRPHGSPQVVQREVRNTMLDVGESGVQGVYSDV